MFERLRSSWFLEKVKVKNADENDEQEFLIRQWLDKNSEKGIFIAKEVFSRQRYCYKVSNSAIVKFSNFQKILIACDSRDHELGVCTGYIGKLLFYETFLTVFYVTFHTSPSPHPLFPSRQDSFVKTGDSDQIKYNPFNLNIWFLFRL